MEPDVIYEMECPKCSSVMRGNNDINFKCTNSDCGYNYINIKRLSYSKFQNVAEPLPWKNPRPVFVENEAGKITHRWHYGRREWVVL